jgi:uroporphyrinogen decarboxylase
MNSRERVRMALNHLEPDRVPIGICGNIFTGIHVDEYIELARHLDLNIDTPKVYDQFQMLSRIDDSFRSRIHADMIELENPSMTWGFRNNNWKGWISGKGNNIQMPTDFNPDRDEMGYIYINDVKGNPVAFMPPGGLYFERTCPTGMSDYVEKPDPEEWKKSLPIYTDEELKELEKNGKELYENTQYSICGAFNRGQLSTYGIYAGHTITDWMLTLMTDEEYAFSILRAQAESAVENLKLYLQAVGNCLDTIVISGFDFGIQDRELFDPEIFRKLYMPNYKLINDYVHNNSNAKTLYHSCGSNWNLMEYFIEAGCDVFNPVQTTALNMDPVKLKEKFGSRITFLGGGIDTQTVLPFGTREKVVEQVKERIKIFSPGGGFIFSQVHNTQYGVPPENFLAMVDTAYEFGVYPIEIKNK